MEHDAQATSGKKMKRAATVVALGAALAGVAWMVTTAGAEREDRGEARQPVKLADVVAHPDRYEGKSVTVAGRIRRRHGRSYELKPRGQRRVLLVRRRRTELRPHLRRGDRVEVIGEVRAAAPGRPRRVAAELIADEVLLFDRADTGQRKRKRKR